MKNIGQGSTKVKIFASATPRLSSRDTSLAAAESIDQNTMSRRMHSIFSYIRTASDGATCWEVERALGLLHQTTSSYIRKLFIEGRLKETEKRRPTNTGRMAIVWEAA